MLLPLLGGAYTARSVIANAQRCVNLYPESNPQDSEAPTTHYLTPGLTRLSLPPLAGNARGAYRATNGLLYAVVGSGFYYISPAWTWTLLGNLKTFFGPVSMVDNNTVLVIVDGSGIGWQYTLPIPGTPGVFSQIETPFFFGADRCDYVDTFLLFNLPNTQSFYSSLSNELVFDPLYIAAKTGFADKLVTLIIMHRDIWLLGELTTEVWYNAGNPGFPFAITPGVFIEHGCVARYSVAKHDLSIFWLSNDKDGQSIVLEGNGYLAKRVSTFAIEQELGKYPTVNDAIGMTYQQQGHVFYVLKFPTANKCWVFDKTVGLWHERTSLDATLAENGWKVGALAFAYGTNIALDYTSGTLYKVDLDNYGEDGDVVNRNAIVRRRSFPHIVNDGKRSNFIRFTADMEAGGSILQDDDIVGNIYLRYSDDRGKTFTAPLPKSFGKKGEFKHQPEWRRLGVSRDRVFELFWSSPAFTALNGAYVDKQPGVS